MQEKSTITSKGQITLPIAIRRRLGLKQGDLVVFDMDDSGVVQLRPEKEVGRFAKYRGVGAGDLKTKDDIDQWLKELRGREE